MREEFDDGLSKVKIFNQHLSKVFKNSYPKFWFQKNKKKWNIFFRLSNILVFQKKKLVKFDNVHLSKVFFRYFFLRKINLLPQEANAILSLNFYSNIQNVHIFWQKSKNQAFLCWFMKKLYSSIFNFFWLKFLSGQNPRFLSKVLFHFFFLKLRRPKIYPKIQSLQFQKKTKKLG